MHSTPSAPGPDPRVRLDDSISRVVGGSPAPIVDVCVFDLRACAFKWSQNHAQVTVVSPVGEILGSANGAGGYDRDLVFDALEDAAARCTVRRDGGLCAVGFYNPLTYKISIRPLPSTVVYSTGNPVVFGPEGMVCTLRGQDAPTLTLPNGTTLRAGGEPTMEEFLADLAAHQAGWEHPAQVPLPDGVNDHLQ